MCGVYMSVYAPMWYACMCTCMYDVHECIFTCMWHACISNVWMHYVFMCTWTPEVDFESLDFSPSYSLRESLSVEPRARRCGLAPGTPCLCPLSAGTGGRSSCPPGIYIGSGEMQLSGRCLCDKHSNRWTIPSPNLCFWNFHEYIYIYINHIHSCYLLLPPYAELIKKFLMFFCLFVCLLLNVLAQVGKKNLLVFERQMTIMPWSQPHTKSCSSHDGYRFFVPLATEEQTLFLESGGFCAENHMPQRWQGTTSRTTSKVAQVCPTKHSHIIPPVLPRLPTHSHRPCLQPHSTEMLLTWEKTWDRC